MASSRKRCHLCPISLVRPGECAYPTRLLVLHTRPTTLKKFFQLLFVFLGCLQLVGGPYAAMQVYAWAGMLVSYSQDGGIVKAAKETFSGEKPCSLCCKISAARKAEGENREPLAPVSGGKQLVKQLQEMIPTGEIRLIPSSPGELPLVTFTGILLPAGLASASPPTPPPRAVG